MFWERCKEYYEVYKPENEDMGIQIGQIFCTHFFGKKENGSHAGIIYFIGIEFLRHQVEVKKFLDEVLSKFEVVL